MLIRTFHDKRLAYLVNLEKAYQELGFTTKLNGRNNLLEIYSKGFILPQSAEETLIEKWID